MSIKYLLLIFLGALVAADRLGWSIQAVLVGAVAVLIPVVNDNFALTREVIKDLQKKLDQVSNKLDEVSKKQEELTTTVERRD
jgi:hypothetical protein